MWVWDRGAPLPGGAGEDLDEALQLDAGGERLGEQLSPTPPPSAPPPSPSPSGLPHGHDGEGRGRAGRLASEEAWKLVGCERGFGELSYTGCNDGSHSATTEHCNGGGKTWRNGFVEGMD